MSTTAPELVRAALTDLGVGAQTLTDAERRCLDEDGYVVLPELHDAEALRVLHGHLQDGLRAARDDPSWSPGGTLHLADLLDAGPAVDRVWTHPRLLAAVAHLLGEHLQVRGVAYRGPQPGYGAQLLHQDFGRADPADPVLGVIALVALREFTVANGATRLVRGSHRTWGFVAPTRMDAEHAEEEQVPMAAGSVLVFNGYLWHSGVRNRGESRRDALQIRFARRGSDPGYYPDVGTETLDRLGSAAYLLL